jgi:hypothetical protein
VYSANRKKLCQFLRIFVSGLFTFIAVADGVHQSSGILQFFGEKSG